MKFDIEQMESAAGKTFDVVVGERDDGSPVGFRVLGPDSDEFQQAERDIEMLGVKESAAMKKGVDITTDEGAATVVEGAQKSRDFFVKRCTVGWFGFTINGEEAEFTPENFGRVLAAKPAWRRRILRAIEDEENFAAG